MQLKSPTIPFRIVACTFSDNLSQNSCIQFHDPYDSNDSYRSWNNGLRFVHFVNCISLNGFGVYIQVHDPYDSYDSYGSWNNGLRVEQFVNFILLERLRMYIQVHDPYDSYGSWNNGLRVVHFVSCIKQCFTSRTVCEVHIIRDT